jgi:hypothetical protein
MKKILLSLALFAFAGASFAQTAAGAPHPMPGGGPHGDHAAHFAEHKAHMVARIQEHIAKAQAHLTCVQAAQTKEAMHACMPPRWE